MADGELIGVLQSIMKNNYDALKPAELETGTVLSTSPLLIQINANMPPIPAEAIVLTWAVKPRTVEVTGGEGGTVVVNPGLQAGDNVIMLRVKRGQKYIVLSTA